MMHRLARLSGVAAVVLAAAGSASFGADKSNNWPQWRGPTRDGISTEKGFQTTFPADGPKIAWKAAVGKGYSSFTVVDGKVLTQGSKDGKETLWCFNADTGEVAWKIALGKQEDESASTPAVADGKVYAMSRSGAFTCANLADGKILWTKDVEKDFGARKPQYKFATSPLILDKNVILDVGVNVALDRATGEIAWKAGTGEPSYGSPVPFKSGSATLLALFHASGLILVDSNGGSSIGSYDWRTTYNINAATPIITPPGIFISSGYGHGCALVKPGEGKMTKTYENKEMENQYTSCVFYDGYIYGMSDGGKLRCLDVATGKAKWTQTGLGAGGLIIADGKLIIMADKGKLEIAEAKPDGYKALASATILSDQCWTAPVLSDGRIYCRNTPGTVVCVDVRGK